MSEIVGDAAPDRPAVAPGDVAPLAEGPVDESQVAAPPTPDGPVSAPEEIAEVAPLGDGPWWSVPVVGWTENGTPLQKRALTTRRALMLAAARQFDRHGYHAASLAEILTDSGRTKGALYFHFRSKQDLAVAVLDEATASWGQVATQIASRDLDPLCMLLVETDAYVARWSHDPLVRGGGRLATEPGAVGGLGLAWYADWQEHTACRLAAARDAGILRESLDPDRTSRLVVAAATGHHTFVELTEGMDFFERMTDTWQGLLPVIAEPPWLARWEQSGWATRRPPNPALFRAARDV